MCWIRIQVLAIIVFLGLGLWLPSGTASAAFQSTSVKEIESVEEELVEQTDQEPEVTKGHDNTDQATTEQITGMPPAGGIVDVAVDAPTKGAVKVVISADGILPRSKSFTLPDPSRLVIDIPGIKLLYPKSAVSVQNDLLKKIRMATKADGVRIVFDSKKTALFPYSIDQTAGTITVWIGKQATARLRQESRKPEPVVLPSVGTIEAIDFDLLDEGKVCLTVTADRKLPYKVINVDKTTVLLRLSQALLPKALARPYDTSYFKGAVEGIIPQQSLSAKNTVDITIKMRDEVPVPFQTVEKENTIQLEFAATTVPPKPDQLARMAPELTPEVAKLPAKKDGAAPDKDTVLPPEFSDLAGDTAAPFRPGESAYGTTYGTTDDALPRVELPFGPDKVYTGQKISLDFQNADIHNVLRLLAEVSKLNIVAGDDVTGKVTLKLDRVPWDQALDVVLA
ncbi:MAG: AMIN domain-containing protein, partial [Deltaproteobacteria bacterium]|nr:AMIN domain-containing protein [Deltaproteobacteria bacterium]